MAHQLFGAGLGFADTGLVVGDIDVIVDVAVVSGKMTTGNSKRDIATATGKMDQLDHNVSSFEKKRLCLGGKKRFFSLYYIFKVFGKKN
jgi:hypothetical protein